MSSAPGVDSVGEVTQHNPDHQEPEEWADDVAVAPERGEGRGRVAVEEGTDDGHRATARLKVTAWTGQNPAQSHTRCAISASSAFHGQVQRFTLTTDWTWGMVS
ncbi:MAG TPA: hypothetical protein P5074_14155 [Candidatus Nanopelagicales bacterium]|nr:hypothetical protein [Candidatus Nanopelagicales bacterium]